MAVINKKFNKNGKEKLTEQSIMDCDDSFLMLDFVDDLGDGLVPWSTEKGWIPIELIPSSMNREASHLKDQDLIKWIENKLGDPNELWVGRQASSLLSKEMIIELETCFQQLEPHVKLKIIQAIIHLSPKLIHMWREPLNNLLDLARRDADDWVETVADMYRDFPNRGCIQCTPANDESYFYKTLVDLEQILKKKIENVGTPRVLPPDCSILSHSAIKARYGYSEVELKKCFVAKKNTKAQQLLEDVERTSEQQGNPANKKSNGLVSSFPIKMRSTARKPNNDLPMRGIPSVNTCKISGGFTNEPKKFQRHLMKREGAATLIDITELPQFHNGKRRKTSEIVTMQSKKVSSQDNVNKCDSDTKVPVKGKRGPAKSAKLVKQIEPKVETVPSTKNESKFVCNLADQMSYASASTSSHVRNGTGKSADDEDPSCSLKSPIAIPSSQLNLSDESATVKRSNSPIFTKFSIPPNMNPDTSRQLEELVSDANKLTSTSFNLIAAFLSGNRNNVLQDKLGSVVTLPLSETLESSHIVETFFQMDYMTGEWKRLRKVRPPTAGEAQRMGVSLANGHDDESSPWNQPFGLSIEKFFRAN